MAVMLMDLGVCFGAISGVFCFQSMHGFVLCLSCVVSALVQPLACYRLCRMCRSARLFQWV